MGKQEGRPESAPAWVPKERVYDHARELERWKSEYLEIRQFLSEMDPLKPDAQSAGLASADSKQERRTEPRYAFKEGSQIFAHLGPKAFEIINISIGGVAFFSDVYFEQSTKLLLSALGMIALDVEILSCEMEEVHQGLMEYRYRVRSKFGPRVNGYQVYVLAREMYLQQQGEGAGDAAPPTAPKEQT